MFDRKRKIAEQAARHIRVSDGARSGRRPRAGLEQGRRETRFQT